MTAYSAPLELIIMEVSAAPGWHRGLFTLHHKLWCLC